MSEGADCPTFAAALEHHRAGRLEAAEGLYRQVGPAESRYADALHLRGVAVLELGRPDEALDLITAAIGVKPAEAAYRLSLGQVHAAASRSEERIAAYRLATTLDPELADAWFGLGAALHAANRHPEAIDAYRQALFVQADHVAACHNLACSLEMMGQLEEAIALYRRVLELEPTRASTHNNLSSALFRMGRWDESIASAREALACEPGSTAACNNLGCALTAARRLDEAVDVLRRAIALCPDFAEAWFNLSNALREQAQFAEAAVACRRAIALQPKRGEFHINLGNILCGERQFVEAVACYRRALELRPNDVEAYSNLGNALRTSGQIDEAIAAFRTCLSLRPEFHVAHCNLGNALKDAGQIDEAIASFRRAVGLCPSDAISHSNLAYSVYYHPGYDSAAILAENRRWNAIHAERLGGTCYPHNIDADSNRRLRIGYLGADFRDHCQSLFTIPLFSHHDHERFEIFCYANVLRPDSFTQRLKESADCWRDTAGWNDEEVARQVHADGIDILVDLTMHMSNGRPLVLARKAAPIQVVYLAYPGTAGLSAVDYRLTDPFLDPPGQYDGDYAEQSFRLPETFWCYDPQAPCTFANSLPADREGRITFGCLNNFCKVTENSLDLWSPVLEAVVGSRLLLLSPPGRHRDRVRDLFRTANIDPRRIEFVEYRPRLKYLELYHRMDISLDTLPYNGHTTSLDSLWMGVPVVTRVGRTVVGRAGHSQLSNLGLSELVAWSDEEFVAIATRLAHDRPHLARFRATLRGRMEHSPLMDAARFARNIETAYRTMWLKWCQCRQTI